jgi:hypothetical protein
VGAAGSSEPSSGPLDPRTWDRPRAPERSRFRVALPWVATGAVVVAVFVVTTLVFVPSLWFGSASVRCNPSVPSYFKDQLVLVHCGTTEPVGTDHYWVLGLPRESDDQTLFGEFSGTVGLSAYLLNGSQVLELLANPHPSAPPSASFWNCTTRVLGSCAVSTQIPPSPGQYSLAIENLGSSNASATWTESLLIAYTPSLPALA